jgi:hypothetical protein
MVIRGFPGSKIQLTDLGWLVKNRVTKNLVLWPDQGVIVHLHYDLTEGRHQQRGGASVGKSIALIDAKGRSKGTGAAKLWEIWKKYKDAAHLITAAVLVSAEVQTRNRQEPYGMRLHQFQPYRC